MRIGICDDEVHQRNHLRELCLEYAKEKGITCEIIEFSSGNEVILYSGEILTLLFLDIEMQDMNGIEVMKKIEKSSKIWRIVFASNHEEEVWSTFGLKTLDFGRKPIQKEQLARWLKIAQEEFHEEIIIEFECENEKKYCRLQDIVYLEALGNYVLVHNRNQDFIVSRNLKYWQEQLPERNFLRAHKSYLVNIEYITEVVNKKIQLRIDGITLPIGRVYHREVILEVNQFRKERMRKRLCN